MVFLCGIKLNARHYNSFKCYKFIHRPPNRTPNKLKELERGIKPTISTKALNNKKFCCCHGCNLNIKIINILYSENNAHNCISAKDNQPSKFQWYREWSVLIYNFIIMSFMKSCSNWTFGIFGVFGNSEKWIVIITSVLLCTLLVIYIVTIMVYPVYHTNMLATLGKPLSYIVQFMDSTGLRAGTNIKDYLKLTIIVGMFFVN